MLLSRSLGVVGTVVNCLSMRSETIRDEVAAGRPSCASSSQEHAIPRLQFAMGAVRISGFAIPAAITMSLGIRLGERNCAIQGGTRLHSSVNRPEARQARRFNTPYCVPRSAG
jgi:hypothetical protein